MKLVTLAQVSAHLRRDTTADDADLEDIIEAASEMVVDYIGAAADAFLDSAGDPVEDSNGEYPDVPKRVQRATCVLAGFLYKERDGSNENQVPSQWGYGYLPVGVVSLLYSMRKPTVV